MRPWRLAFWLAGLALSLAASWAIWRYARIPDADLRFAACLAPPTLWALVPVVFWRFFARSAKQADAPGLRDQRRAVRTLLADRGYKGRRARYSVPFYLVVGAPGVGKSSLLDRSGLGLTMPVAIGGATWWVGKEAVFVEASLGLPDRSLHEVCDVLRSLRPLQPVNGTILVLSPADLTLADQAEHREMAQTAAQGLREIEEATGQSPPVYLALAKVDLLPGFLEFFDRQEQQERSQPWGFALPFAGPAVRPTAAEAGEALGRGFEELLEAMRVRLVEWLSREADAVRCARINGFGTQIANLNRTLQPMLSAFLPGSGSTTWRGAALRGVYLTSARQEALSIDGLLPELSRRFAMPRIGMLPPDLGLDDEDHGYFIGGMFAKAVFPEAGLVARNARGRFGAALQWAAVAAIVAASAGTGYLVFQAFDGSVRQAARAAEIPDDIRPIPDPARLDSLPSILAAMRRLEAFGMEFDAEEPDHADLLRLSARPPLAAAAQDALDRLRRNAFAPSLTALLETQLVDLDADIETLRGRIALAEDPAGPGARPAAWLEEGAALVPEADRAYFVGQGAALFLNDGGLRVDPAYLDAARRIVAWKESLS